MEILKLVGLFLIQPLLWVGVLTSVLLHTMRIKSERKNFRIAINKDWYEPRHFVKKALGYGILMSIISIVLGLFLPRQMIGIYELLAIIALCFIKYVDLSTIPLYVLGILNLHSPRILSGILLLTAINYFVKQRLVSKNDQIWFTPQVKEGKRGNRIAQYYWREMTVLPLVILIPGELTHYLNFLPVLHLGDAHFSFFILPFLVASVGQFLKQKSADALKIYRKQNIMLVIVTAVSAGLNLLLPKLGIVFWLFPLICAIWLAVRRKIIDEQAKQWYSEVNTGIRVVAIRPDTPAAKMNLEPGDIILNCNGRLVSDENQFYAALQLNSAYVHLKVQTFTGDLKITEGAIYNDSPHELGIVLFRSKY